MKKFLLLLHENAGTLQHLSPAEMEALAKAHYEWAAKLEEGGHFISGDGLEEGGVRITGKKPVVQDGPYMESKEIVGGYYLLQARDLDTVIRIAKECPTHLWGGTTEIRPIMEYEL
ncbi:Uncharacterized conserved protein [Sinomicrobium oceani]|uniref:Uncharacterized conserved protein n=1 Tax=Sinomicrobium oceani TaxID=1150368 RepID=A0A1K1QIB5_9FLAO|nr:YciI family protein [Sinomicrobium oceani]SFW59401.1 Uncharacterized conserved protein [Sinomicrobium oceani]